MAFSEKFKFNFSTLAVLSWISLVIQYSESDAADIIRTGIRARFEDSKRFYQTGWGIVVESLEAYPDIRAVVMNELHELGYNAELEEL